MLNLRTATTKKYTSPVEKNVRENMIVDNPIFKSANEDNDIENAINLPYLGIKIPLPSSVSTTASSISITSNT